MKTSLEILGEKFLIIEEGKTVEAHTHLVQDAMDEYAGQLAEPLQSAIKLLELLKCSDELLEEIKKPFNKFMINILLRKTKG